MPENGETAPLLEAIPNLARNGHVERETATQHIHRVRAITYTVLTVIFVAGLVSVLSFWDQVTGYVGGLPKDPHKAALILLRHAPIIVSRVKFNIVIVREG